MARSAQSIFASLFKLAFVASTAWLFVTFREHDPDSADELVSAFSAVALALHLSVLVVPTVASLTSTIVTFALITTIAILLQAPIDMYVIQRTQDKLICHAVRR